MNTISQEKRPPFRSWPLRIVHPAFGSPLTDSILSLESYRGEPRSGSTPAGTFAEIKAILHMLESIGSARIEGNNTTVAEYVDAKLENRVDQSQQTLEIENGEKALALIDEQIGSSGIDRAFLSELHKLTVKGLLPPPEGDGSVSPGTYRDHEVKIRHSEHVVVPSGLVPTQMEDLLAFVKKADEPKFHLLKIALAHHRFAWIHPFDNGNGRTARLFTYTMLLKYGFGHPDYRLINPVAIFCEDRKKYYAALARADAGDDEGLLAWCEYMLSGLKKELDKINRLSDYEYLKTNILLPSIDSAFAHQILTPMEAEVLRLAIRQTSVVNGDITKLYPQKNISSVSRVLADLRKSNMLLPFPGNLRKYRISLVDNPLFREVVAALKTNGFWPTKE